MFKDKKILRYILIYVAIVFGIIFMFNVVKQEMMYQSIDYTQFKQMISDKEIQSVDFVGNQIQIEPKANTQESGKILYTTNPAVAGLKDDGLVNELLSANVQITVSQPQNYPILEFILSWVAPLLIFFLLGRFMFGKIDKKMGGGVMSFGKNNAKLYAEDETGITFDDVAGQDEAKESLKEIVDFMHNTQKYTAIGAKLPKGALLVGPPGTGVPFFSISGSDFVEMFVGMGASRVRDLFKQAEEKAPCIVFIDEIDAIGKSRDGAIQGNDEREQTLNQLLTEMDGFDSSKGVVILAATNRPEVLDKALLRPGRFDRQIVVGAPDVAGREAILKVHTRNKHLGDDVELKVLAKRTPGFTGADLENLTNEAALLAVRRNKMTIDMDDIEEAITRVIAGPEKKSRVMSAHDKKITAYHEAGHAVAMRMLEHSDPVHEISIIPRGMAAGYTMHLPENDRSHISKLKLKDDMVGLLGGRVAEQIIIGDISTGAKNDIDRTSSIARSMVMQYGMSSKIGTISFGNDNGEVFLGRDMGKSSNISEETSAKIDEEVKALIDEAYKRAEKILNENVNKLHAVAQALLEKEKIDGEEFERIFQNS